MAVSRVRHVAAMEQYELLQQGLDLLQLGSVLFISLIISFLSFLPRYSITMKTPIVIKREKEASTLLGEPPSNMSDMAERWQR